MATVEKYQSSFTGQQIDEYLNRMANIVNNLSTNNSTLPLSAAQGVALKTLIDNLETLIDNINNILSCSTVDNGKFLRVIDGEAVWDTVFKAEEVQF